jgi:thiol-disulfide isomerase/thioredoxin
VFLIFSKKIMLLMVTGEGGNTFCVYCQMVSPIYVELMKLGLDLK